MRRTRQNTIEPMIYARYCVADEAWQFFVAEVE
jgi:hypothetical protein